MKGLHMVAWILVMIGGLNWGLVGLGWLLGGGANWNLINLLIGSWSPAIEGLVYILVGLSAVYEIVMHKKNCKVCGGSM